MVPCSQAAPAKLNLYLRVLGRRPDGYHEIETLFLPVPGLVDRLTLDELPAPGLELQISEPALPCDRQNLVWRAAEAFAEAAGLTPRWRFTLEKHIPLAGGLGGGSSDAAATLRLLNHACGSPLPPARLHALAAGLGADVPFFLDPRPAVGRGIGELLEPVAGLKVPALIVVNPGFPSATPWAYAHWADVPPPPAPSLATLLDALRAGDGRAAAAATYNALEFAVRRKFPLLDLLCEALCAAGCAAAHVSGSGASVYGVCLDASPAAVGARVQAQFELPLRVFGVPAG
jgi:4-diphosphocytidyl-2-C-methyl-D-erythritol kinase